MTPEQHNLVAKTPPLVTSEEKSVKEETPGEVPFTSQTCNAFFLPPFKRNNNKK